MQQVTDAELVVQAQAGQKTAFAELYERHFDGVYDFLTRMLRNPDEASDLAQDAFLKAMRSLGTLQQPERFKSWLYTIARNAALNRIERAGRTAPLVTTGDDGEEVAMDVVDSDRLSNPEEAVEAQALAVLVWEASAGLDPRQLSILDLHLRQGMESAEIADVLGVTKNNGYVLLNRLKKAVEDSIGAFVMLKEGRNHCSDLNAELADAEIDGMSPDVRKLINRHNKGCLDCEERRKRLVSPLAVFGSFVAVGAPIGVKAQILQGLQQQWPVASQAIGGQGGSSAAGAGGGPPVGAGLGAGSAGGSFFGGSVLSVLGGLVAGAGLLAAVLLLPFSPRALTQSDDNGPVGNLPTATATNSPTPTRSPTETPPRPGTTATATRVPTSTAIATVIPTATTTPTITPTPTPTQPPCDPTVATSHPSLSVAPGGQGSFFVSDANACESLTFTVRVTSDTPWLAVNPPSGTVRGPEVLEVEVAVNESKLPGEGTFIGQVAVANGDTSIVVQVSTQLGGPPVIEDVSPRCEEASIGATITAIVSDDFGVASVTIVYNDSMGISLTESLSLADGDARSGIWEINKRSFGPGGFTITAVDGGGLQAQHHDTTFGLCQETPGTTATVTGVPTSTATVTVIPTATNSPTPTRSPTETPLR